jgi:hypothetical protein
MSQRDTGGFALLEIVVALGLLAVSMLVIVQALGAAFHYLRAASAARRAVAVAAAVAHTFDESAAYPAGWRVAGTPGADGLPGTGDDGPPAEPAIACRRRVVQVPRGDERWLWVEAACDAGGAGILPGGRLASGALLLRGR